jgi:phosphate-transporting ATPase
MTLLSVRELERPGLGPVSFELQAGECLIVRGASGTGKSLMLRAIADLDPSSGEVELEGRSRGSMPAPAWRRQVGYLPAETGWWAERVDDHFEDWSAAGPMLEALGLEAGCGDWPITRLSTGERQRLGLIRALLVEPRVMLLDEPTSGLDPDAAAAAERLVIERLQAGAGALWVTHDAAQATRLAERALRMLRGGVLEEGTT